MSEQYIDIKGYEGIYKVSDLGNVISLKSKKPKLLKQGITKNGYRLITLFNNGKRKSYYVHRLVAVAFIDNVENKGDVNHKDEIKTNNAAYNLEWVTRKENLNYGTHNQRMIDSLSKGVIAISDGGLMKPLKSATEAAKHINKPRQNIVEALKGKRKKSGGYKFIYQTLRSV